MKKVISFVAGLLFGALLFGGGIAYAASDILAERSTQSVFVDGQRVELEAYLIDGANYVKLRDVGQAVGFNVFWDGAVQIQSDVSYTGEAPATVSVAPTLVSPSPLDSTDYSAAANPEIFTGIYTREAYNAAYAVLTAARAGDLSKTATVSFAQCEDRQNFEQLLAHISNGITLSLRGIGHEDYEIYAHMVDQGDFNTIIDGFARNVDSLSSDYEKIVCLNKWVCEHMEYNSIAFAGTEEVAVSSSPVAGNCASYARMMNHLCGLLGIPCIKVYGESHCWNVIYADGSWGYTDVSLNDQVYGNMALICSNIAPKQISDPDGLRFLQELLVPGSTK